MHLLPQKQKCAPLNSAATSTSICSNTFVEKILILLQSKHDYTRYITNKTSIFLLPALPHNYLVKVLHFKNTCCIRSETSSLSLMQKITHVRLVSASTDFLGTTAAVKTSFLELLFPQNTLSQKYTCLSPQTGLPSILSDNPDTLVTLINACNFETVHCPAVQHAHWQPSNSTSACRFSLVKDRLHTRFFRQCENPA